MKNTYGAWTGDYWGAISIGYNANLVSTAPTSWQDLLKPAYKGQVALNGSPLTSGSAVAGVFAAALGNGGSLSNVQAGIDFFAKLKSVGNWVPVQSTPQTVASGQTPISIDWDYLNLAYTKQFPSANWKTNIPSDGVYGAYYCQAINATAPHPWAARLWEEFCYSDQGQLIWLKGFAHPARFADLSARKVIPASLLSALPSAAIYNKVKFASLGQQSAAKTLIAAAVADEGRREEPIRLRRHLRRSGRALRPAGGAFARVGRDAAVLRLRDRRFCSCRRARCWSVPFRTAHGRATFANVRRSSRARSSTPTRRASRSAR